MITFLRWGVLQSDIDALAKLIEQLFDITLVAREGHHKGEYYSSPIGVEENFAVQPNYVPYEDGWTEEDHKQYPCLLYVSTRWPDEIIDIIAKQGDDFVMLRRKDYKDNND